MDAGKKTKQRKDKKSQRRLQTTNPGPFFSSLLFNTHIRLHLVCVIEMKNLTLCEGRDAETK